MVFRMIMNSASDEERPLVRGFLRYLLAGFGIGVFFGLVGYGLIMLMLAGQSIDIPILFIIAMLIQAGALGGLVGVGLYMSTVTDRSAESSSNYGAHPKPNDDKPLV